MLGIYDVLKRPLVTESGMRALEKSNTYVFEVHPKANKIQIRNAVERLFSVKVLSVNTANMPGKTKRTRIREVQLPDRKKAYVRLREGDSIEVF